MRNRSRKTAGIQREASRWRALYRRLFPVCQFPGCKRLGADLHEISRGGARLASLAVFPALLHLCRWHHEFLHRLSNIRYSLAVKMVAGDGLFAPEVVCELYGWAPTAMTSDDLKPYFERMLHLASL